MKVFVEMPIDTPFKPGDIVLERGFRITNADSVAAANEDAGKVFFRPLDLEPGKLLDIAARLQTVAKEIENLC